MCPHHLCQACVDALAVRNALHDAVIAGLVSAITDVLCHEEPLRTVRKGPYLTGYRCMSVIAGGSHVRQPTRRMRCRWSWRGFKARMRLRCKLPKI